MTIDQHAKALLDFLKVPARPVTDVALARARAALPSPIPPELEALWRVTDRTTFWAPPYGRLYSIDDVPSETEGLLAGVGEAHSEADARDSGLTLAELSSREWIAFAGMDHERLAIHSRTGTVALGAPEWPPLFRVAASLEAVLERLVRAANEGDLPENGLDTLHFDRLFGVNRFR